LAEASTVNGDKSAGRAVQAYLDHLTVERGLAGNTLSAYRRDLSRYASFVRDLATVTERDVLAFVESLRTGDPPLSAASTARAVSAVRGLHRFALREGLCTSDPARDVPPPALPRRLPKALDLSTVERILAVPDGSPLGLRDRALLEFLYGTGARISEAVGLAVDDLDLEAGAVVLHGKGGRTRVVPVGGYARAALEAYLVRARPGLRPAGPAVFLNARGGRLTRQGAFGILRDVAARAGVAGPVSPHALRHSYATHLLDGGADVRVVQELLGHASVTTTQVYTLVTVDRLREVYATTHPRAR